MDGRTPVKSNGYYVLTDQDEVVFRKEPPANVQLVTVDGFARALTEGCRHLVKDFAESSDNEQVYAFCLYTNEYKEILIYMNTLARFEKTLESYKTNSNKGYDEEETQILKYHCGDFDFQLWNEHMGESGRIVEYFEKISRQDPELKEADAEDEHFDGEPIAVFEEGIIVDGYYVSVIRAIQQLTEEGAFDALDKAENFIAYASTDNAYLDYGLVMRKTIDQRLFYQLFPDMKESDARFKEAIEGTKQLSLAEAAEYWLNATYRDYDLQPPYSFKSVMDVFTQLQTYGSELVKVSLDCLQGLARVTNLEDKEHNRLAYYLEALYFCGPLTSYETERCREVARNMELSPNELIREYGKELETFAR